MTNDAARAGCSYFGVRIPRHVRRDMADLAARGYTGVLHTFSENDFAYYRDTMAEIVAISHAAGLSVLASPWGLGRTFGGEAESRWVAFHPEECQVLTTAAGSPRLAYQSRVPQLLQGVGRLRSSAGRLGLLGRAAWVVPRTSASTTPSLAAAGHRQARRRRRHPRRTVRGGGFPRSRRRTPREAAAERGRWHGPAHARDRRHEGLAGTRPLPSPLAALATDPYWKHHEAAGPFVRLCPPLRARDARHGVGAQSVPSRPRRAGHPELRRHHGGRRGQSDVG
jgi:hypothetical protein